jgi:hypothetical protein
MVQRWLVVTFFIAGGEKPIKQNVPDTLAVLAVSYGRLPSHAQLLMVNKAVHYNAWANFGKKDFEHRAPVRNPCGVPAMPSA